MCHNPCGHRPLLWRIPGWVGRQGPMDERRWCQRSCKNYALPNYLHTKVTSALYSYKAYGGVDR